MIIVAPADFVGIFEITQATGDEARIQAYIDQHEADYIYKLLGAEMGADFISSQQDPTIENRYANIRDAFVLQDNSTNRISKGMAHLLKAIIYYHYISETQDKHTQSGVAKKLVETSNIRSTENAYRFAERRFNEALDTWDAIQWYIERGPDASDYGNDNFQGEKIGPRLSGIL